MTFGNRDFVGLAESFGAVLIDCPIDYSEEAELSRELASEVPRLAAEEVR